MDWTMKNIDEKDYLILDVIKKNAEYSTQQIAKKTGIPITTVHNRIKKLERSSIIKGYTVVLNSELMGDIVAFVLISVTYHGSYGKIIDQEILASRIKKNEMVEEVNIITGGSDLIVKVRAKTIKDLNNFVIKYLRTVPGIDKTETLIVLKSI